MCVYHMPIKYFRHLSYVEYMTVKFVTRCVLQPDRNCLVETHIWRQTLLAIVTSCVEHDSKICLLHNMTENYFLMFFFTK